MQLVYAVAVVHNLESAHHEARYVRLILAPQLLPRRVVLPFHLPVLGLYLPQPLESALQGLHVVVSFHVLPRTRDGSRHILGVGPDRICLVSCLLKQIIEIRNKVVESDGLYIFSLE